MGAIEIGGRKVLRAAVWGQPGHGDPSAARSKGGSGIGHEQIGGMDRVVVGRRAVLDGNGLFQLEIITDLPPEDPMSYDH